MTTVPTRFARMLAGGPILLSGAMGTELLRRGVPTPMPLWSTAPLLEAPEAVAALHRDYVKAGAQIVTANTFRTDRRSLAKGGLPGRARELDKRALSLARRGVASAAPNHDVLVAASIAPLEDCYTPEAVPDDDTLRIEHGVKVGSLVAAGAELAMIETMNTTREAVAALRAAEAGNLPRMVSFVCAPGARLLSGEPIDEAVAAATPHDPLAILVNCCAVETASEALAALRGATDLPVGVYANGCGHPDEDQGWAFDRRGSRKAYTRHALGWLDAGARLVGGCCGTDPRHIRALSRALRRRTGVRG